MACQSLHRLHTLGLVGAVLGLVFHHWLAHSRHRVEHAIHGESQPRAQDLVDKGSVSDLDTMLCANERRAGDAVSVDRLAATV